MLDTSIFPFSHNVFKKPLSKGRQKSGLCGKGLSPKFGLENFLLSDKENQKSLQ